MNQRILAIFFLFFVNAANGHEFVSEDGGFVKDSGFKTPVAQVVDNFERYRFLRGEPKMKLYRTSKLKMSELLSRAARYKYRPDIKKNPVDWWAQLREKCKQEYIPTLPTVVEGVGARFFFFNQHGSGSIKIYGVLEGKLFGLTIWSDPSRSASGLPWERPVWSWSREVDSKLPEWRAVWRFVDQNRLVLIKAWETDNEEIKAAFDKRFDGLF